MAISLNFRRFCWFWRHGKTGVSLPQIGITSRTRLHLRLVVVYCYAIPSSPWWSSFHWFETHQIPLYSIIWMLYPLNPIQHSKLSLCLWHAQHSYYEYLSTSDPSRNTKGFCRRGASFNPFFPHLLVVAYAEGANWLPGSLAWKWMDVAFWSTHCDDFITDFSVGEQDFNHFGEYDLNIHLFLWRGSVPVALLKDT